MILIVFSGTPIQNSLEDMFSLLHFLKVANFSDRWWWNLMIIKPIHRNNSQGFMRLQVSERIPFSE